MGELKDMFGDGHVLMTLGITKSSFTICIFKFVLYFGRIAGFLHSRQEKSFAVVLSKISMISS